VVRTSLATILLASIAVISGTIVLLGYFLPLPGLAEVRTLFMDWALILAAVAALVGVVNLMRVHWHKIRAAQKGSAYSAVTLLSLVLTLALLSLGELGASASAWVYDYILVPIEASLLAVLAVTLIYAFARTFRRRFSLFGIVFAGTVLFVLLLTVAWPMFDLLGLRDLRGWWVSVFAAAGARGILLGVALGVIATGLRVILGSDRPYSR
jgi:hypothetical protein